jgi:hypothetical protein
MKYLILSLLITTAQLDALAIIDHYRANMKGSYLDACETVKEPNELVQACDIVLNTDGW